MNNACTIGTPCHENWTCMTPNAQGRHCATCNLTVIDLTRLTAQARVTVVSTIHQRIRAGERVCVRGNVTRDGLLAGSRRILTGGMALMLAMAMAGCTGDGIQVTPDPHTTGTSATEPQPLPKPSPHMGAPMPMGEVCVPPSIGDAMIGEHGNRPAMGLVACPVPAPSGPVGQPVQTKP